MDAAGAVALRLRIEQHRHWCLAEAVQDGRQSATDPDVSALREFRGNDRVYQGEVGSFAKRLIDGAWAQVEAA